MSTIEKVRPQIHTPRTPPPLVNRMMSRVLRSPLSRLVDKGILLLTVHGRRTGRAYTFPVQYIGDGQTLWVMSGAGAEKTWWRNLVGGAPVEVLLARRVRHGRATAFTFLAAPDVVTAELRRYFDRYPGMAKRMGVAPDDDAAFAAAAAATVMVRIDLTG